MNDPIADMLTRIRNAGMARLDRTEIPFSKVKLRIAQVLVREGYISEYRVDDAGHGSLTVFLKYVNGRQSAIIGVKRASRPGRRLYVGHSDIPEVHNGLGVAVISTSQGLFTDEEARKKRVGGELLFEVW